MEAGSFASVCAERQMQNVHQVAQKFNLLQIEYETMRQRVGLETLKQLQEQAAKEFVARHLDACLEQCHKEKGFFVDAVQKHIQLLQSSLR